MQIDWQDRAIPSNVNPYEYLAEHIFDKLENLTYSSNRKIWKGKGISELDYHRALWYVIQQDFKVLLNHLRETGADVPAWDQRFAMALDRNFVWTQPK